MKFTDLTLIAWRQVIRMRRRYLGPLLGGILGTAALIVVITIGDRVEKIIGANLSLLGSAPLIKLYLFAKTPEEYSEDPRHFNDQDLQAIRDIPGVQVVAPAVYSWWPTKMRFDASWGTKIFYDTNIMGVDSSFFKLAVHIPIAEGRSITDEDNKQRNNVCVIGKNIREWFFQDDESALNNIINIEGIGFKVVGILGDPDDGMFNDVTMIPLSSAKNRLPGMFSIRRLTILPESLDCVEMVSERARELLLARKPMYHYVIWYDAERIEICRNILNLFKMFVYTAVFATLFLSGVGIANVMLAMVKERTAEIGLRKAVGASKWNVASQFLGESVVVSCISSSVGILIGSIIALNISLLAWDAPFDYLMYKLAVGLALVIALISGVGAGYVPASRAARLDPVTAMKFE